MKGFDCELRNCNGFDLLESIPSGSVNLLLTDQPYETTYLAFDSQPIDYKRLFKEAWRVLEPSGWLILFGRGRFVASILEQPEFLFERVWLKSRKTLGQMAKMRPLLQHEWILHLNRDKTKGVYNPQITTGHEAKGVIRRTGHGGHWRGKGAPTTYEDVEGRRYPTSLMPYDLPDELPALGYDNPVRQSGITHPTAKPLELLRELVLTHSNKGDLVVDPFCGGDETRASTAEAAYLTDRRFLGSELSNNTWKRSKSRLDTLKAQPGLF